MDAADEFAHRMQVVLYQADVVKVMHVSGEQQYQDHMRQILAEIGDTFVTQFENADDNQRVLMEDQIRNQPTYTYLYSRFPEFKRRVDFAMFLSQ